MVITKKHARYRRVPYPGTNPLAHSKNAIIMKVIALASSYLSSLQIYCL